MNSRFTFVIVAFASFVWLCPAVSAQIYQPGTGGSGYSAKGKEYQQPWDMSLRAFFIYNDNTAMVADSTPFFGTREKSSFGAGTQLNGGYRFVQNEDWEFGVRLGADYTGYFRNGEPNDWSFASISPAVYVRHLCEVADMPASVGMSYRFSKVWRQSTDFSKVHALAWDASLDLNPQTTLNAGYSIGFEDHVDTFANRALQSRDATAHALSFSGTYRFHGNRRSVTLGYQFGSNDSKGANYEGDAHAFSANFKSHLVGPLWIKLDASYALEDYDNGFVLGGVVTPPGRTDTDVQNYGVTLLYQLTKNIAIDAFFTHTRWDSNQALFDGDRNTVGMGITYKF